MSTVYKSTATYNDEGEKVTNVQRSMRVVSYMSTLQSDVQAWEVTIESSERVREANYLLYDTDEKFPIFGVTFKRVSISIDDVG